MGFIQYNMSLFEEISGYYNMQDSLCVFSDINGLMEELKFQNDSEEWRILICVSKIKITNSFIK